MQKKNKVQDVIPPKKSIRNVTLDSRTANFEKVKPEPSPADDFSRSVPIKNQNPMRIPSDTPTKSYFNNETPPSEYKYEYDIPKKRGKKGKYFGIGLILIVLIFGASFFFKGAEIRITPKQESKQLNSAFIASREVATAGELSFQTVTLSKDVEKTIPATDERQVERKATGTIIVYNNYDSNPQRLIATTRFETPEGLVYRIPKDIVVPGRKTVDGKVVAGSVETLVEADQAGEEYNIGMKDFTIPGFKGTPRFNGFYARSKTEISGGFKGIQRVVSDETVKSSEIELEASVRNQLSQEIISQVPSNFILYPDAIFYETEPAVQMNGGENSVLIKKKGTATAIVFDKGSLTRAIINKTAPEFSEELVKINNLNNLKLSFPTGSTFNPNISALANFNLEGSINFVWIIDENKLKTDLLGLSKKNAKTLLGTYSTINEAWIETKPFWNQTIPKDPEKVVLINTVE